MWLLKVCICGEPPLSTLAAWRFEHGDGTPTFLPCRQCFLLYALCNSPSGIPIPCALLQDLQQVFNQCRGSGAVISTIFEC